MNQTTQKIRRFEIEYTRVAGTHEIYDMHNTPGGYATPLTRHTTCEMLNEYYAQNIALRAALESMCDTFGRMFDNMPPPDEFESDARARAIVESARSVLAQAKGQSK
jgi:coenzyme F420-reducing hydrogenase alpha subunit